MAFATGSAIAPVMGGKLTDIYGFQATSDIVAIMTLGFAFVNFCIVFLPNLLSSDTDKRSNYDMLERLHKDQTGSVVNHSGSLGKTSFKVDSQ